MPDAPSQQEQLSSKAWWLNQTETWIKATYQPSVNEDLATSDFVRFCLSHGDTNSASQFVNMRAKEMPETQSAMLYIDIASASASKGDDHWRHVLLGVVTADPKVRLAIAKAWHDCGDHKQAKESVARTLRQIEENPTLATPDHFALVASTMGKIGMGLDAKPIVMRAERLAEATANNQVNDAYTRCLIASVYAELGHDESAGKHRQLAKQIYDGLEPQYRWWVVGKYFALYGDAQLLDDGIVQLEAEQDPACRSRGFARLAPTAFEVDASRFDAVMEAGCAASDQYETGRGDLFRAQDLMGYAELAARSGNRQLVDKLIIQAEHRAPLRKEMHAKPMSILNDVSRCWELADSSELHAGRVAVALEVLEHADLEE